MTRIQGAVALVTGAAGGIGAAITHRLRADGATVVGADLPGRPADVEVDVTDSASVSRAITQARTRYGRLDIVVAAAGVGAGAGLAEEQDEETWRRAIDVNLWGSIHTARAGYAALVERAPATWSPADAVAGAVVRAIRKNRALVAPGRAGALWRAVRFTPRVVELVISRAMRRELSR